MTQVDVALGTITHLDFVPVLPCEHSQHMSHHFPDDPARWEVRWFCRWCKGSGHYWLCESGRVRLYAAGVVACTDCRGTSTWDDYCVSCHPISEVK
jgi:hypothetical protein